MKGDLVNPGAMKRNRGGHRKITDVIRSVMSSVRTTTCVGKAGGEGGGGGPASHNLAMPN